MKMLITATAIALLAAPLAQAHARSHRPYYGGGHHTSSHGGHYSGAHGGSSHKGGHYHNARTGDHYGRHR